MRGLLATRRAAAWASASATRCSARRSAATTSRLKFGHHGGNHPVQGPRRPAGCTSPRRTTSSRSTRDSIPPDSGLLRQPDQPERRLGRGARAPDAPGVLGAVPPGGLARARRTTSTCSTGSSSSLAGGTALMAGRQVEEGPGHRLGADRHRPGGGVRLRRHAGLQGAARGGRHLGPRQLQPGHDHDRRGHRRRRLHRAADRRGARADHRAASGRTGCCRRSAGRPASTWPSSWPRRACSTSTASGCSARRSRRSRRPRTASCSSRCSREIGEPVPDSATVYTRRGGAGASLDRIAAAADHPAGLHARRHRRRHRHARRRSSSASSR